VAGQLKRSKLPPHVCQLHHLIGPKTATASLGKWPRTNLKNVGVLPSSSDLQFLSISQLNRTGWEAFCLATFALSLIVWTNKGGDIIDLI